MVVSMLEAELTEEGAEVLVTEYRQLVTELPPFIVETFLLRPVEGNVWRLVTVWESQEAVAEFQASVETPGGVLVFRAAGAEPTLSVFQVAAHASN